jgi:hypothetical protein
MLPKIDVPIYSLELISNKKIVNFRPFTVKEEKLFLMAMESKESETTINTIKQVINNCILDDIDINSLPIFDLEYIFLNLRAKSVGEDVKLRYKCNHDVEKEGKTEPCNNVVEFEFNLLDVKPSIKPNHDKKIEITDKLGIVMKYPNFEMLKDFQNKTEMETVVDLIINCIDFIYDGDDIFYAKDSTKEELAEFIDSLQSKDLEKLKDFFDTMPKLGKELNFKCNKCGYEEKIDVEGIESFFV